MTEQGGAWQLPTVTAPSVTTISSGPEGPCDLSAPPLGPRVLLWGPAAVEHHKTCRSLGQSLWQQPSVGDILCLLDRDRMMRTILHFPQNRRLLPPEVRGAGHSPRGALVSSGQ